ncbi:MAG: FlgD immunoglobulin-like domain containing protein [bacterium]
MRTSGLPGAFAFLLVACALCSASAARAALEIVGPREVEERFVVRYGPNAYLTVGGRSWELVTDPRSPLVSSLGDGSFHPMDAAVVEDALAALGSFADRAQGRILILPYPRRSSLKSSCEDGTIFLSPGIRDVSAEHVHATVVHEVGHLLQARLVPEGGAPWAEYVVRRGLGAPRFDRYASHRDRPREIFAEDFRFLFGGPLATSSGSIENPDLPLPSQVPGLSEWFRAALRAPSRALPRAAIVPPAVVPNPVPAGSGIVVRFHAPSGRGPAHADVYDLGGRLVKTVRSGAKLPAATEFSWNGRDAAGTPVAPGLYFVRWRENPSAGTARIQLLR